MMMKETHVTDRYEFISFFSGMHIVVYIAHKYDIIDISTVEL